MWENCMKEMEKYYKLLVTFEITHYKSTSTPETQRRTSIAKGKPELLTTQQQQNLEDKFIGLANDCLNEAMRSHHNYGSGGVPWFFWLALLFFGYDDLWRYCQSPFIWYPLLLAGAIVLLVITVFGKTFLTKGALPLARMSINLTLRRFGIPVQI